MINLYAIYDRGTEAYQQPWAQPTDASAIRVIRQELKNKDSMLAQYPTDYELWKVGEYDEQTGIIKPVNERINRLEQLTQQGE